MLNSRQEIKDENVGKLIKSGPFLRDVRNSITQVSFAPNLFSYVLGLPPKENGYHELSFVDFDGVVVDTTLLGFAGQILGVLPGVTTKDFNHINSEAKVGVSLLKERGPVILTTNRSQAFNWLIEKCGATTEAEIINELGLPSFADSLDRQNPFRNRSRSIRKRIMSAVKESGGLPDSTKRQILRLVFDINDGLTTFINSVSTNIGMPLELNSIVKIRNACRQMGIKFDEVHLGIIDPKLKMEP